jgi:NTE family protein
VLSPLLDIFRMRQYFDLITRARQWAEGLHEDAGLLADLRRALLPLPTESSAAPTRWPFPAVDSYALPWLDGRRLGVVATGGSGALASVVGVARALEEAGVTPAVYSLCSGSALFGFPLAAGVPPTEVGRFTLSLSPAAYIDVDWLQLAGLLPRRGRGFAGVLTGERIERSYRRLLGDMTLGEMPVPAYAPIWNIEENRVEYLGPQTHPELSVARAIHMAIALPLFVAPVSLADAWWCDGGIVDIFPVRPLLDIEERCDVALAVNGFYPPDFAGENVAGWAEHDASILYVASQVRTCQQAELARVNLDRLRRTIPVVMIEPVPYSKVKGAGFYRQFLSTREWPDFMRQGRLATRRALVEHRPALSRRTPRGMRLAG